MIASTGSDALSLINEKKPDLVLLDIMMPDLDGFEVCKTLHDNEETKDIPVIMLTARISKEDLKMGFDVGAVDYIEKPFDRVELIARIESALKLKQLNIDQLDQKIAWHKKKIEESLELLVQNAPVIILTVDCDGKILTLNRTASGANKEDRIGKTIYDFIAPEYIDKIRKALEMVFQTKKPGAFEILGIGSKGPNTSWYEISAVPIEQDGLVTSVMLIGTDITERKEMEKELRKSEQRNRLLFENAVDPVFLVDLKGNILMVNKKFEDRLGYSRNEVIGKGLLELGLIAPESLNVAAKNFLKRLRGIDVPPYEIYMVAKDGRIMPFELNSSTFMEEGKLAGELISIRDITERKEAEKAIRSEQEKYQNVVETIEEGIFALDKKGFLTYVNPGAAEKITGYTFDEVVGMRFTDLFPKKKLFSAVPNFHRILKGESLHNIETELKKKDGTLVQVSVSATPKMENGKLTEIFGVISDITERKKIERELQESEKRYSTIVEESNDVIVIVKGLKIAFANQKAAELSGYTLDDVGMSALKFVNLKKYKWAAKNYFSRMAGNNGVPSIYEAEIIHKDGHYVPVELSTARIEYKGGPAEVVFLRDVTYRREMEMKLRKSEEKYSTLVELSADGILLLQDMRFIFANQRVTEISGYEKADLETLNFMKLIPKEQRKILFQRFLDSLSGKEVPSIYELKIRKKSGKYIWVEANANRIEYNGKPADLLFIRDITERKKIEDALRESEKRYSTIVEESNDAIVIFKGLKVVFANKKASELSGYPLEAVGSNAARFVKIEPERLKNLLDNYRRKMAGEEDVPTLTEINIRRKDGQIVPAEASSARIEYQGGPAEVIFIRDITERKQAEAKLNELLGDLERSNEELEQFAYVASHDLQEPLRMVSSYVQLLSKRYKGKLDSDADEFIYYAVDGAKRMQEMIKSLLTYSRVGTHGKSLEPVDCEAVLDQALENLAIAIEESGAVITRDPMPDVVADDVQLVQLFQNLIGNGIKYHGEKSPCIHVSAKKENDEWVFSVKDNGIGIDPEYKDQIFKIFQRLHDKEYSGTGIGLSVCKKIVERHGGKIWVESEPGVASTFYFTIPIKSKTAHLGIPTG